MVLVTADWKGDVMEINNRSMPMPGSDSLLLMVITTKLMVINRASPTKISCLPENITSANDYFFQNIDIIKGLPTTKSNRCQWIISYINRKSGLFSKQFIQIFQQGPATG